MFIIFLNFPSLIISLINFHFLLSTVTIKPSQVPAPNSHPPPPRVFMHSEKELLRD